MIKKGAYVVSWYIGLSWSFFCQQVLDCVLNPDALVHSLGILCWERHLLHLLSLSHALTVNPNKMCLNFERSSFSPHVLGVVGRIRRPFSPCSATHSTASVSGHIQYFPSRRLSLVCLGLKGKFPFKKTKLLTKFNNHIDKKAFVPTKAILPALLYCSCTVWCKSIFQ